MSKLNFYAPRYWNMLPPHAHEQLAKDSHCDIEAITDKDGHLLGVRLVRNKPMSDQGMKRPAIREFIHNGWRSAGIVVILVVLLVVVSFLGVRV